MILQTGLRLQLPAPSADTGFTFLRLVIVVQWQTDKFTVYYCTRVGEFVATDRTFADYLRPAGYKLTVKRSHPVDKGVAKAQRIAKPEQRNFSAG